ncbi:hypothetical protein MRB53_007831 [Persea americana]|uniref:Uncharacterized protein n=1 Tax=Persea americana TaxID=3435 RepID=A0ACC2MKQ4_PERAE|nr:hypothetical protein MRB53_007831 [Persea americana]
MEGEGEIDAYLRICEIFLQRNQAKHAKEKSTKDLRKESNRRPWGGEIQSSDLGEGETQSNSLQWRNNLKIFKGEWGNKRSCG